MKKKYLTLTALIIAVVVLVGGVTYAFYEWISGTNTDITFNVDGLKVIYNGGTTITDASIIPTSTKEEGILKTLELQLDTNQVITPAPTASLFLDLTSFPSNLADASFKWELYKNDDLTSIANGTFENRQEGDSITLISNQTVTSTKDTYKLYLWINGNEENNSNMQNQQFTFNIRATGTNSLLAEFVDFDGVLLLSNGKPCQNCSMTLHSNPITTTTNSNGEYSFTNVPVGRHTITALDSTSTEILNDSLVIKTGNNLTYNNNTITTNLNKLYMNINISASGTLGEVLISDKIILTTIMVDHLLELAITNTNEIMTVTQPATTRVNHQTTEYRYYGATPNNYIYYNCQDIYLGINYGESNYNYASACEKWRIIGVFETETPVYTGNTITSYQTENRVKIIRDESLGYYTWDSSATSVNGGTGINAWEQADLMNILNGIYMTKESSTCYDGNNNATTNCDFTTTGLNTKAKELIKPAKYYLGGTEEKQLTSVHYAGERGTVYKASCTANNSYCTDTYNRKGTWTGYIGLMYASDYGYAAGSTCINDTTLYDYNLDCKNSDWLFNSSYQWTISPRVFPTNATLVFSIYPSGQMSGNNASYGHGNVRPVVYLSSDVKFKDGQGTTNQPFIIGK